MLKLVYILTLYQTFINMIAINQFVWDITNIVITNLVYSLLSTHNTSRYYTSNFKFKFPNMSIL